jgi:hypothetical protein
MTTYLAKTVGKVLFPRLPRERRKKLLSRIILILMASFCLTVWLVVWILRAVKHVKQSDVNLTINF